MSSFSAQKVNPDLILLPTFSSTSQGRLKSLYSDFARQKRSNPTSYNANIEWWRRAIEEVAWKGLQKPKGIHDEDSIELTPRLVLTIAQSLVDSLRVDGVGKPIGLGAVITELQQPSSNKLPTIIPLSTFLSNPVSILRIPSSSIPAIIATYLVSKPLWWALEQMGIAGEDGILQSYSSSRSNDTSWHGDYVVLALLEKATGNIRSKRKMEGGGSGIGDSLFNEDSFKKTFASCIGSGQESKTAKIMPKSDFKAIVKYLERDKQDVVVDKGVIKFLDKTSNKSCQVTSVDVGVLELKVAVENMHAQVNSIQMRIDQLTGKITAALKQNRKSYAMTHLRSRKHLEDLLKKRLGSLDNLESTLISVEGAAGDIQILETFQSSTATLRSILSHPSLQRESVDATMEALAEANADAKEIDSEIRFAADSAVGIDDADIDDELEALIRESEKETKEKLDQEICEKLSDTGKAPSTLPSAKIVEEERQRVAA